MTVQQSLTGLLAMGFGPKEIAAALNEGVTARAVTQCATTDDGPYSLSPQGLRIGRMDAAMSMLMALGPEERLPIGMLAVRRRQLLLVAGRGDWPELLELWLHWR
jgi:hypothetical protein